MRTLRITLSQITSAAISGSMLLLALTACVHGAWLWLSPAIYQSTVQAAAGAAAAVTGAGPAEAAGRTCDLGPGFPRTGPIIIGGVGDSGTRGVLAAFQAAGFYMGGEDRTGDDMPKRDLGAAGDKVMFAMAEPASRRHLTALLRQSRFQETGYLLPITPHWEKLLFGQNDPGGIKDVRKRGAGLCRKVAAIGREAARVLEERRARGESPAGWGWKNPKSALLLSAWQELLGSHTGDGGGGGMTFVHVVRDGRDVAYGDNRQQYDMFVDEVYTDDVGPHRTPMDRMRWWAAVNTAIHCHAAATLPPDRYIVLRIEDLVTTPVETLFRLFHDRLGLDVTAPGTAAAAAATVAGTAAIGGEWNGSAGLPQELVLLSEPLAALAKRSASYAGSYLGARYSADERKELLAAIGDAGSDALELFGYRLDDWGLAGPCGAAWCI